MDLTGIDRTLGGSVRSLPLERPVSRYRAASGLFPVSFSVMSGDPYINLIRSRVYPNRRHRRPEPPQLQPALTVASARARPSSTLLPLPRISLLHHHRHTLPEHQHRQDFIPAPSRPHPSPHQCCSLRHRPLPHRRASSMAVQSTSSAGKDLFGAQASSLQITHDLAIHRNTDFRATDSLLIANPNPRSSGGSLRVTFLSIRSPVRQVASPLFLFRI